MGMKGLREKWQHGFRIPKQRYRKRSLILWNLDEELFAWGGTCVAAECVRREELEGLKKINSHLKFGGHIKND